MLLLLVVSAVSADPAAAQHPFALAYSGTAALEEHRFGDALDAFTTAAALQPEDASLFFGAGVAAFMLGQDGLAQSRFERALALQPDHLAAAMWLGDLHYRAGRLQDAIAVYQTALKRSKSHELRHTLATWRKELKLESRFREARTEHFTALFEAAGNEPLAREVLERLEAAYGRVGSALGAVPGQPVTVVLYTRQQFRDFTKLAAWSVAAYDGRIRLPLESAMDRDDLDRVLSHELVHAIVAAVGGRTAPAWLSEGLATVLEPAGSTEAESALAGTEALPGLTTLHQGFVGLPRQDVEIAYALAARAVRRLMADHGAPAIVSLLQDLRRGEPFASAFHRRIGTSYEEFAARVARE
jgi:tetratricopeptide (TPR) repeat protein